MITGKSMEKFIYIFMVILFSASMALVPFNRNIAKETPGVSMGYEEMIFQKDNIISIELEIDNMEWDAIMKDPEKKEYHPCNITINGEKYNNVGIRAKGESSLEDVKAMRTSDRYSFAVKFDKYVDGQTCYGLDKLLLNNNYADITHMKDAITYDMCAYIGLAAPLYHYAKVSKNGEYFGCYLLLEPVGRSFCKRNFGEDLGGLYEPTEFGEEEDRDDGGNLNYIDDKTGSYSGIFDLAKFGGNKKSKNNVVAALKSIHTGKDIEAHVDVEQVLKYMAIQTIAVNLDSLSGSSGHNCFLYEKDGKIRLIPWDYNLAYGGYMDGVEDEEWEDEEEYEAQLLSLGISRADIKKLEMMDYYEWLELMEKKGFAGLGEKLELYEEPGEVDYKKQTDTYVNFPIDTPFTGNLDKREFFMNLLKNDAYRKKYHEYLSVLSSNYIRGSGLLNTVSRIQNEIDGIVCTEPNSFFTKEQYEKAVKEFVKLLLKKSESVDGQLKGVIPSTREGQEKDQGALILSDDIDIRLLGGE